ncbi:putative Chase2 sensor protein [Calothrix sp. NIES-4071]|nr:putative Chase2 sensor protein [Calothrix sp. NIES-4071]BAZ55885.1 putative Chase2 sensor protein [Calothrix sp. NIES-4105]
MEHLFNLKVQRVEQICLFELSWGQGQKLAAQVEYPAVLTQLYQDWKKAYLKFYQSEEMRGKAVGGGVAELSLDWHAELVKAESKLIYEFNSWLRSAALFDIRAQLNQEGSNLNQEPTKVFLTCAPIELDRFPWEAWESEFTSARKIQIIRSPQKISAPVHSLQQKGRTRILTILGDDTGLDFQNERAALKELSKIADVEFVGWQPNQTPTQVIDNIINAIADERGWDVLFFAGHSNETDLTGGELGIAPGVSISIKEIATHLNAARQRRLKVAIFNSCSGLNIAESLIDLGFSQVMVMREPVHNRVAQEFLVKFLLSLGKHLNVYESMMEARQFLRLDKSHTYPSSYLLPSLFCHPGAELYKIPPSLPWHGRIRQIVLPNSIIEAVALTVTIAVATMVPVQDFLLDGRIFTQAVYRETTKQIPDSEAPPVALVEIDSESITKRKLPSSQILPMNRSYIAELMERVRKLNAPVIGLDFLIDTPQKYPQYPATADKDLGTAVSRAVNENRWVVFGTVLNSDGQEASVNDANGIKNRNWTLQGYTESFPYYVELPEKECYETCPISYLMALTQLASQEITDLPKPGAGGNNNLRTQLLDTIKAKLPKKGDLTALKQWRPLFGQQPIIDFSIPPEKVYTKIPAWQLMENPDANKFPLISKQAVIIATGNDERLGKAPGIPDRMVIPTAMKFWTEQSWMTGGQSLAYTTHHFIRRHLITPIPDIWIIALAILVGKITVFFLKSKSPLKPKLRLQILTGALLGVVLYGVAALQLYITAALLLPWFLPSSVFLAYVLSATRRQNHA